MTVVKICGITREADLHAAIDAGADLAGFIFVPDTPRAVDADADGDGYRSVSEVRGGIRGLSESLFAETVHPVLMERCAACHQPFGGIGIPGGNHKAVKYGSSVQVLTVRVTEDMVAVVGTITRHAEIAA